MLKMSKAQSFKAGFLLKCIEDNLSDSQVQDRINYGLSLEKQALVGDALNTAAGYAKPIAGGLFQAASAGLVGVPLAVGSGLGYLSAKATSDVDKDVEGLKEQELIDTYNFLANDATRRAKFKRLQQGLPHTGKVWSLGKGNHIELPK